MFVSHRSACLVALVAFGLAGSGAAWSPGARAEQQPRTLRPSSPPQARHFSASLAIRHRRFTSTGTPVAVSAPDVVMRMVREHRGGRWKTSLSVDQPPELFVDMPGGRTRVTNPFLVTRVELDDGDQEPRLFDRQGRRVRAMTMADLKMLGAAEAVRGGTGTAAQPQPAAGAVLLAEAGRQAERRQALARAFGAPVGRVRGLDRYVSKTKEGSDEVLVAPDTALPVELASSSAAAGDVRTEVAYQAYGAYGHVRRLMRSEHRFAQADAGRVLTEVELANVVISDEVMP